VKLTPKQKAALKKEAIKTGINIALVVISLAIIIPIAQHQIKKAFEIGLMGKKTKKEN
jgi:uncharacterized membrane protein (DUF441 family)